MNESRQWSILSLALGSCLGCTNAQEESTFTGGSTAETQGMDERVTSRAAAMVRDQVARRGIRAESVLEAMRRVPRHRFVPRSVEDSAYDDRPLSIGHGQTISQPYVVAFMTDALQLDGYERVLEIGTGSGYQAAVLAEVAGEIYTIEIVTALAERAESTLRELGYTNVHVRAGDGYRGWPAHAPFDAIMVTAAPNHIPQPLIDQLAIGGRMILPVGDRSQDLVLIVKTAEGVTKRSVLPVRFVPMTGEAQRETAR